MSEQHWTINKWANDRIEGQQTIGPVQVVPASSLSDLRSAIERLADEWEKRGERSFGDAASGAKAAAYRQAASELRSLTTDV